MNFLKGVQNVGKKVCIGAGAVATTVGPFLSGPIMPILPLPVQKGLVATVGIAGILAGLYHPTPGAQ